MRFDSWIHHLERRETRRGERGEGLVPGRWEQVTARVGTSRLDLLSSSSWLCFGFALGLAKEDKVAVGYVGTLDRSWRSWSAHVQRA